MVVAKANKMLGFPKRKCAGLVNREALLRLYYSLVRSLFLLAGLGSTVSCK